MGIYLIQQGYWRLMWFCEKNVPQPTLVKQTPRYQSHTHTRTRTRSGTFKVLHFGPLTAENGSGVVRQPGSTFRVDGVAFHLSAGAGEDVRSDRFGFGEVVGRRHQHLLTVKHCELDSGRRFTYEQLEQVYICVCLCMYVCVYVCIYVCICICVCMYTLMYVCKCVCIYVNIYM